MVPDNEARRAVHGASAVETRALDDACCVDARLDARAQVGDRERLRPDIEAPRLCAGPGHGAATANAAPERIAVETLQLEMFLVDDPGQLEARARYRRARDQCLRTHAVRQGAFDAVHALRARDSWCVGTDQRPAQRRPVTRESEVRQRPFSRVRRGQRDLAARRKFEPGSRQPHTQRTDIERRISPPASALQPDLLSLERRRRHRAVHAERIDARRESDRSTHDREPALWHPGRSVEILGTEECRWRVVVRSGRATYRRNSGAQVHAGGVWRPGGRGCRASALSNAYVNSSSGDFHVPCRFVRNPNGSVARNARVPPTCPSGPRTSSGSRSSRQRVIASVPRASSTFTCCPPCNDSARLVDPEARRVNAEAGWQEMRFRRRLLGTFLESHRDLAHEDTLERHAPDQQRAWPGDHAQALHVDVCRLVIDDDPLHRQRPGERAPGTGHCDLDLRDPVQLRHCKIESALGVEQLVGAPRERAAKHQQHHAERRPRGDAPTAPGSCSGARAASSQTLKEPGPSRARSSAWAISSECRCRSNIRVAYPNR